MTIIYILALVAGFAIFALIKRRFLPIAIGFGLLLGFCFVSIAIFGFMPNYSKGVRAGVVQKYSVKGIIFKSGEVIMFLPVEGIVMTNDPTNLFTVSCVFSKTPEDCKTIEKAVATRQKILVEYQQWLKKPITQDSDYTVRSAKPVVAP